MLIAIHHKGEGEEIRKALLTVFWTRTERDDISYLRAIGMVMTLPIPTFFKYEDFCTARLMQGMRLPRIGFRISRMHNRKPRFDACAWLQPVLSQKLIATREQIEDGIYPVRTTTKGESDVREN